jgi:formylglycine-generating enzyme required for sulfatase activity
MTKPTIYTVGGTVQAGGGVYLKRKADDELLELCRQGEIALVLSSRQVGKSSLMVRTAQQLEVNHVRSVIIDLNAIGTQVSQDEWYLGILNEISASLDLKTDIFIWWTNQGQLGPAQRMTNFFRDIMLREVDGRLVLFFDEIDSTLSISFADDFFAALRAVHNARSTTAEFKRLSFVLIGVATPSDLIIDNKRTPFNLGRRVELTDFTLDEASPLAEGLGETPEQVLSWIFKWTGGHPYLTQHLCSDLAKYHQTLTEKIVDADVERLFTGEQGWQNNNLQFVRDMLVKRAPDIRKVLKIYSDIRSGKKVEDDERSIAKAHLKIAGVVRRQNGDLVMRNKIYERAFDLAWIKENTPARDERRYVVASSVVTIAALMLAAYFAYQEWTRPPAERFELDFLAADTSQERLNHLAKLFALEGEENIYRARKLFSNLSREEKLDLFALSPESILRADQLMVAREIFWTLGFKIEKDEIDDELLARIRDVMREPDPELAEEADSWLRGRLSLNDQVYGGAKEAFDNAINRYPNNPAIYFDRARTSIGLGEDYFPIALEDLSYVVQKTPRRSAAVRLLINSNVIFKEDWEANKQNYPDLTNAVIIQEVLIPEGEFKMGSKVEDDFARCKQYSTDCSRDWYKDEEPRHIVYLDAFYIDAYEVTNARYAECIEEGGCSYPSISKLSTGEIYFGNPDFANYPVIYVSWFDAKDYCEWREARLPTEAEWEKAARGTDVRIYPWGDEISCSKANYRGIGNGCVGMTTEVGHYPSGKSPYGLYDMAGNAWEWVADWYGETYYSKSQHSNPLGPISGSLRVLRGGPWDGHYNRVRSANRGKNDPTFISDFIGFRCARDASP